MGFAGRSFGADSGTEVPKIPGERNFVYNIPPSPFEMSLELERAFKNGSRVHFFGHIQCSFQSCVLLICGTGRQPLVGKKKRIAGSEETTNIYKLGEKQTKYSKTPQIKDLRESWRRTRTTSEDLVFFAGSCFPSRLNVQRPHGFVPLSPISAGSPEGCYANMFGASC